MDYKELKFKAGLEIHQRLDSHKLFCNCPSILRDDKANFEVKRKLRAIAGETGSIDVAAEYETKKDIEFIYEGYSDSTCLVELDESPPEQLNLDALKITLEVAKLLNADIVDEVIFMRKIVLDGSNTSGFQRTALVARNGYLETSKGKVRIGLISLEEEAAKNVGRDDNSRRWRLDRLGIPMIEIQTLADLKDPDHVKETAEKIGMVLRSTGKVMRGIGSIRQDVNVSIKNGARVEIKGFQDIRQVKKVLEKEVERQLKGNVKAEVRNANHDGNTEFLRPMPGAARMYPETDVKVIKITKDILKDIKRTELIDEKILRFEKKYNLNNDIASLIVKENFDFEYFAEKFKVEPDIIAKTLTLTLKDIKSRLNLDISKISDNDLEEVFSALEKYKINKDAIEEVLVEKIKTGKINFNKYKKLDKLEDEIKKLVKGKESLSDGALMGIIMGKFKGKISGKEAAEILKKLR